MFESWAEVMKLPEVFVPRKLSHPHVVTLKDVFLEEKKLYLVFELMNSTVQKMINMKSTDLTVESRIKLIIFDALKGLKAIHDHGFAHWNLKPAHLFVQEETGRVLIGDLSQCVDKYSKVKPAYVGTKNYQAPEVLLGSTTYDEKVDIFALGLIFCHLLLGRPLASGVDDASQLNQLWAIFGTPKESSWPEAYDLALEKDYRFPIQYVKATGTVIDPVSLTKVLSHTSEEGIDLIYKMCMMHPQFRYSTDEWLKHPYFENWVLNDKVDEVSPTYFMNKNFYHPDHDPRVYFRNKIKEKYK